MTTEKELYNIAKEARQWTEEFSQLYPRYYSSHLDGLCAIGTSYLSFLLTKNNIPNKIAIFEDEDSGHCFIVCNSKIIDITATQFSNFKLDIIEIRNLENINCDKYPLWNITKLVDNPQKLLEYQKRSGWCKEHTIEIDRILMDTILSNTTKYRIN